MHCTLDICHNINRPEAVRIADSQTKQNAMQTATSLLEKGECSPPLFMRLASAYIATFADGKPKGPAALKLLAAASDAYEVSVQLLFELLQPI